MWAGDSGWRGRSFGALQPLPRNSRSSATSTRTARHADSWNTAWYGPPDDRLRAQLAAMSQALAEEGRDPTELTRTVGMIVNDPDAAPPEAEEDEDTSFNGTRDDLAEAIDEYAALGVGHLILLLQLPHDRLYRPPRRHHPSHPTGR